MKVRYRFIYLLILVVLLTGCSSRGKNIGDYGSYTYYFDQNKCVLTRVDTREEYNSGEEIKYYCTRVVESDSQIVYEFGDYRERGNDNLIYNKYDDEWFINE